MSGVVLAVGIAAVALAVVSLLYMGAMRSRHHYTSVLNCPKCHKTFDYEWVLGMSFNAVRLGKERYMRCPLCREWSMFNVWDSRKPKPPA